MKGNIDLHCHTTASDGRLSPRELVKLAGVNKLKAIAITDHDSVKGIDEGLRTAKKENIEVVPGVEISCDDPGFVDIHILGLFIDQKNKTLLELLENAHQYRQEQKKAIIKRLQDLGFIVSYCEVKKTAKGEIGRSHIAKVVLQNNSDKVASIEEIFDKYLDVGKRAYVERKKKISIKQAINAIHDAKGIAFIAHPGVYKNVNVRKLIKYFINKNGDGIETIYDYCQSRDGISEAQGNRIIERCRGLAKKYEILETCGSDFHGKSGQELGRLKIQYPILKKLKQHLKNS